MVESLSPQHFRLFIAIAIPDPIKQQIKVTQDQLHQCFNRDPVRWTKPDQFHLTLRFLGDVEAGSVEPLVHSLRTVCQSIHSLELRAHGVGFFPNARAPRVIWVGVQNSAERLVLLQQAVQQATLAFTREKPEERFSGHITLGRIKNPGREEAVLLASAAQRFSTTLFGEWTALEIHLMRSQLSSQGTEHAVLAAVPFA
jgi:RNA 2',3'-cyclic 3'-phosphodiesterase